MERVAEPQDSGWPAADASARLRRPSGGGRVLQYVAILGLVAAFAGVVSVWRDAFSAWAVAMFSGGRVQAQLWGPEMLSSVVIALAIILAGLLIAYALVVGWSVKLDGELAHSLSAAEMQANEDLLWASHFRDALGLRKTPRPEQSAVIFKGRFDVDDATR